MCRAQTDHTEWEDIHDECEEDEESEKDEKSEEGEQPEAEEWPALPSVKTTGSPSPAVNTAWWKFKAGATVKG